MTSLPPLCLISVISITEHELNFKNQTKRVHVTVSTYHRSDGARYVTVEAEVT